MTKTVRTRRMLKYKIIIQNYHEKLDECKLLHLNGSNWLQNNELSIGLLWMTLDLKLNGSPHSG